MTYKHLITYGTKKGEHKIEYHCTRPELNEDDLNWILSRASKFHEVRNENYKVWFISSELIKNDEPKKVIIESTKGEEDEI